MKNENVGTTDTEEAEAARRKASLDLGDLDKYFSRWTLLGFAAAALLIMRKGKPLFAMKGKRR